MQLTKNKVEPDDGDGYLNGCRCNECVSAGCHCTSRDRGDNGCDCLCDDCGYPYR